MTTTRAAAYRRVIGTLRDIGPVKLLPREEACVREAADDLLFSSDLAHDSAARAALTAIATLGDDLVASARWSRDRAHRLIEDIWACGPSRAFGLPIAG